MTDSIEKHKMLILDLFHKFNNFVLPHCIYFILKASLTFTEEENTNLLKVAQYNDQK